MEQKVLNRITELSNEINSLLEKRDELLQELRTIDKDINILYSSVHELKNLLEPIKGDL